MWKNHQLEELPYLNHEAACRDKEVCYYIIDMFYKLGVFDTGDCCWMEELLPRYWWYR